MPKHPSVPMAFGARLRPSPYFEATLMDATMNPIELGLEKFVDLKGPDDFVGKAALAKIAANTPGRLRTGLFIAGDPIRQMPIRWWPVSAAGSEVGVVTSALWPPGLERNMAYAVIATEFTEPGAEVVVHTADGERPAVTTTIPFESPRY